MIRPDELVLDHSFPLGGGDSHSGCVYKANWTHNGLVAVKVFAQDIHIHTLHDYMKKWADLKHPNVLEIFGISSDGADPLYMITPYQSCGNVRQFLRRNPSADRPKLVLDVALGMQFIHSRNQTHGSLKPTNVLVNDDGTACISDCAVLDIQPTNNKNSYRYFSPEAWNGSISRPSDVFAFAMTAYEIFSSTPPWHGLEKHEVRQLVVEQNTRPDPLNSDVKTRVGLTESIWDIIEECWHQESRLRPLFEHILTMWHQPATVVQQSISRPAKALPKPPSSDAASIRSSASNSGRVPRVSRGPLPRTPITHNHSIRILPRPSIANDEPQSAPGHILEYSSSSLTPEPSPYPVTPQSAGLKPPDFTSYVTQTSSASNSVISIEMPTPTKVSGFKRDLLSASPSPSQSSLNLPASPPNVATPRSMSSPQVHHLDEQQVHSLAEQESSLTGTSAILVAGALQAEVKQGRHPEIIDMYLSRVQSLALGSPKLAQKLVTAGVVPTIVQLLETRAGTGVRLEAVLVTLGVMSYDAASANAVYRTNSAVTLMEIVTSSLSDTISSLALWCLSRICRSSEIASGMVKQNIIKLTVHSGLSSSPMAARNAAWLLGNLIRTDHIADCVAESGGIPAISAYLSRKTALPDSTSEDICAGLFAVARLSRTIKLAKSFGKAKCIPLVAQWLNSSEDPQILHWSSRAVGCLMRPNSSDLAKMLLDHGIAKGLARMPTVMEEIEPLASFAFTIQRFSCAEWGGGTRKALVDAGVVDSLLIALKTAASQPFPDVHVELALACSFIGDVAGSTVRKEIVTAGAVQILKDLGAQGPSEVTKACNMAVTTLTGNLFARNAASARTALTLKWVGGCPDHFQSCPTGLIEEDYVDNTPSSFFD